MVILFKACILPLGSNPTMEGSAFFHTHVRYAQQHDVDSAVWLVLLKLLDEKSINSTQFIGLKEDIPIEQTRLSTSLCTNTRMNDVRRINKLLEQVNETLDDGNYFVGSFETYRARRHRIAFYKVPVLKYVWITSEFIFLRIFPKVPVLKQLYFALTSGKGRLLSKAEMLGRLVCCGFEIVSHESIN